MKNRNIAIRIGLLIAVIAAFWFITDYITNYHTELEHPEPVESIKPPKLTDTIKISG